MFSLKSFSIFGTISASVAMASVGGAVIHKKKLKSFVRNDARKKDKIEAPEANVSNKLSDNNNENNSQTIELTNSPNTPPAPIIKNNAETEIEKIEFIDPDIEIIKQLQEKVAQTSQFNFSDEEKLSLAKHFHKVIGFASGEFINTLKNNSKIYNASTEHGHACYATIYGDQNPLYIPVYRIKNYSSKPQMMIKTGLRLEINHHTTSLPANANIQQLKDFLVNQKQYSQEEKQQLENDIKSWESTRTKLLSDITGYTIKELHARSGDLLFEVDPVNGCE